MAQGHPPAAAMASYRRSRLPFARPQTLQKSAQLGREKVPQQAQHAPRPHAKANTSCFYCASKLLRGTFWAPLKTIKTPAAAFESLRTSKPSAAAFEGVPPALPWYLPRPRKLFLLCFETATWHVLGTP